MNWKHLTGNTGYICMGNCLLVTYHLSEHEIVLIDSGHKKAPALTELFDDMKVRVYAVLNTHLHSDHTANNRLLMETYGSRIYASDAEINISRSRELIPEEWGIRLPSLIEDIYQEYQYPFETVSYQDGTLNIRGHIFETHPLPGHSRGHMGYVTPDGVFCIGDAMFSHFLVKTAKMPYSGYWDDTQSTLQKLKQTSYPYYALAHREIIRADEISDLVRENIDLENRILDKICKLAKQHSDPVNSCDFITELMEVFDIYLRKPADRDLFANAIRFKLDYLVRKKLLRRFPPDAHTTKEGTFLLQ